MHKMGPRKPKHYIFGHQFYSENARRLRFHVFPHFNAYDVIMISSYDIIILPEMDRTHKKL